MADRLRRPMRAPAAARQTVVVDHAFLGRRDDRAAGVGRVRPLGPPATAELLSVVRRGHRASCCSAWFGDWRGQRGVFRGGRRRPSPGARGAAAVAFAAGALVSAAIAFMVARGLLGIHPMRVIACRRCCSWRSRLPGSPSATRRGCSSIVPSAAARRRSQARAELADARIAALQARMQPHFLFNALNTIAALVRTDPAAAEATVEDLSAILRASLSRATRRCGRFATSCRSSAPSSASSSAVSARALPSSGRSRLRRSTPRAGAVAAAARGERDQARHRVAHRGRRVTVDASTTATRSRSTVADDGDGFARGLGRGDRTGQPAAAAGIALWRTAPPWPSSRVRAARDDDASGED